MWIFKYRSSPYTGPRFYVILSKGTMWSIRFYSKELQIPMCGWDSRHWNQSSTFHFSFEVIFNRGLPHCSIKARTRGNMDRILTTQTQETYIKPICKATVKCNFLCFWVQSYLESNRIFSVHSSFYGLWVHRSDLLMTWSSEGCYPPQTQSHPHTPKKKARGYESTNWT